MKINGQIIIIMQEITTRLNNKQKVSRDLNIGCANPAQMEEYINVCTNEDVN